MSKLYTNKIHILIIYTISSVMHEITIINYRRYPSLNMVKLRLRKQILISKYLISVAQVYRFLAAQELM